jgi:hypothetical protein
MLKGQDVCNCKEEEINVEEERNQTIMLFHDKDLTQPDITPFLDRLTQFEEMTNLMNTGADFQACLIYHTKGWSVNMLMQMEAYCIKNDLNHFGRTTDMLFLLEEVINFLDTENVMSYVSRPEYIIPHYNNKELCRGVDNNELRAVRAKNFLASLRNNPKLFADHYGLDRDSIDWTKVPHTHTDFIEKFAGEDGDINQQYKDMYRCEPLSEDDVVVKGEN